jgi:ParB family chromosome partitioning protein
MNTASLQETQALHAVAAAAAAATATASTAAVAPYELHLIPLSRLRSSNRNVRKSGGTSIPELAASNEKDAVMRRSRSGDPLR